MIAGSSISASPIGGSVPRAASTVVVAPPPTPPIVIVQQQSTPFGGSADQIAICNLALASIGTRSTISSLAEGTAESRALSLHYQPALDRLLRAAPWNFARKQVSLALLKDANATPPNPPPSPWVYSYAYPIDCVMLRFLLPQFYQGGDGSSLVSAPEYVGPPIRFVESIDEDASGNDVKVVLTNQPLAMGVYTKRITNTQLFDPTFREAFWNYLGALVCNSLSGDRGLAQQALQLTTARVLEAKGENGNEGLTVIDSMPDWMRVRGIASDYSYPEGGMLLGPNSLTLIN